MFTGIVNHTGTLLQKTKIGAALRLTIQTHFENLALGESIAVDGVCLTVIDVKNHTCSFDISEETLRLTIIKDYQEGREVNLERSLRVGDSMSGHYVTGHVDQVAFIKKLIHHDNYVEIQLSGFEPPSSAFLIPKGSLTINGASLTINKITYDPQPEPSLMLIPHTLKITNLKNFKIYDKVNIEFDYYAKTIAHQSAHIQQEVFA